MKALKNTRWYSIEGTYYKIRDSVLLFSPENVDGTRDTGTVATVENDKIDEQELSNIYKGLAMCHKTQGIANKLLKDGKLP